MSAKLVVASKNPVKINAARVGYERMFSAPPLQVDALDVASGVRSQPMGDAETRMGAMNRAKGARLVVPSADFTFGIEGGCTLHPDGAVSVYAWVVVINASGAVGSSKTGTFFLPEEVAALVRDGMELGHADDVVFGQQNSKQANGSVGLLTGDVITREEYYVSAVVLALIPFKNPALTFKRGV